MQNWLSDAAGARWARVKALPPAQLPIRLLCRGLLLMMKVFKEKFGARSFASAQDDYSG